MWVIWALASFHIFWAYGLAPSGPWDEFNYAPGTRTVYPRAIKEIVGAVDNAVTLVNGSQGVATLSGINSRVTLDFGQEVRVLHRYYQYYH